MSMDDARQDVNTFDIRMAGHIDKVEEKKKKQACFTASRSGTAQHEKGFLGKTRSVCFQLINLIKEEHPPPTRFHSLVA